MATHSTSHCQSKLRCYCQLLGNSETLGLTSQGLLLSDFYQTNWIACFTNAQDMNKQLQKAPQIPLLLSDQGCEAVLVPITPESSLGSVVKVLFT